MYKCPKCGSTIIGGRDEFCSECGLRLRELCPVCDSTHPITTKFCPETGKDIAEYRLKVERKKVVEKEFDAMFQTYNHGKCLAARWKAFIISFVCWESALFVIWWYTIRHMTDAGGAFGAFGVGFTIFVAVLVLAFTWITTFVSFDNKREQLLDLYFGEKIPKEKN